MLFILFGSTVAMGKRSRQFFEEQGFELIQKYNYITADAKTHARFDERPENAREDVLKCDFLYEHDGGLVGFYKEQIIDAVRGRKKCLLTVSSETIDFVGQLKAAYGDYVTVIGTYIDEPTLEKLFRESGEVSEIEVNKRLEIGRLVKENIIKNRALFDELVIYGGEDSPFDLDSLSVQYHHIIEKAVEKECELNNRMFVDLPYTGNEKYIFASFSYRDTEKVFPILHKLQRAGCRVWYDEGIQGGENWRKILMARIRDEDCANFLLIGSESSVKSRRVLAELGEAAGSGKRITLVNLDDARFEPDTEALLKNCRSLQVSDAQFDEKLMQAMGGRTHNK